jgi:hypothetical protein
VFRGGLRHGGSNASWPFATLEASPSHLSIRLASIASWFMKPVDVDRGEVVAVRSMRGWFSRGIRVETSDPNGETIIFWTVGSQREVIAALANRGWPVT